MACQKQEQVPSIVTGNVVCLKNQHLNSAVLGQEMEYSILLPGSYSEAVDSVYPVLYLLHGMGDDHNAWIEKGNVAALVQKAINNEVLPEMIVVMPNAFVTFYVDNYQDNLAYETFFREEFLPYIESEYRVDAQRSQRFIAGLSMGGYGASYYAFSYPEKFCYCYSMSGALEGVGTILTPSVADLIAESSVEFSALPEFTMDCGMQDFLVYDANVSTHSKLTDLEFAHEYIEREGSHDWTFWQEALPMALERIGSILISND